MIKRRIIQPATVKIHGKSKRIASFKPEAEHFTADKPDILKRAAIDAGVTEIAFRENGIDELYTFQISFREKTVVKRAMLVFAPGQGVGGIIHPVKSLVEEIMVSHSIRFDENMRALRKKMNFSRISQ